MIDGVEIISLKQIPDERGKVMHMLRCDSEHFEKFGEIYFSCVYPGAIKGWHGHKKMTLNYAVVKGMVKLVLYDPEDRNRIVLEKTYTKNSCDPLNQMFNISDEYSGMAFDVITEFTDTFSTIDSKMQNLLLKNTEFEWYLYGQ